MNPFNKIPRWEKIIPVFSVIVMMIYTWSLLQYFWRIQSWLNFSTMGEVAVIYAYTAVLNLMESLSVLLVLVLLSILLPVKWFYERFATLGSALTIFGLGSLMIFIPVILEDAPTPSLLLPKLIAAVAAIVLLAVLFDRITVLKNMLNEFAARLSVFLYIWMSLTAISLLTVLVRNIF